MLLWAARIVREKKFNCKKTFADIPLIVFLVVMAISTYFSVDKHVSIFGYPTRLNGGLLSLISYALLYWGFVNNVGKKEIWLILKAGAVSTAIVSIYAILQKFGVDDQYWQEDVRSRVFATFGQPNWLGIWLAATIPLQIVIYSKANNKHKPRVALLILASTLALYFTRSKSALIGLFVGLFFIKLDSKRFVQPLALLSLVGIFALNLLGGNNSRSTEPGFNVTPSGDIRRALWSGTLKTVVSKPILGYGPETFAYVYPQFRPKEHNTTSEWELIYNKAHNEYLNYLATTGILGLSSFILVLIAFSWQFLVTFTSSKPKDKVLVSGFFAGWIALLVSIFFGFTTPTSSLLIFILPAAAIVYKKNKQVHYDKFILLPFMALGIVFTILSITSFISDFDYQKSTTLSDLGDQKLALRKISSALSLNPYSPIYRAQKAQILSDIQLTGTDHDHLSEIQDLYDEAIRESPQNAKLYESKAISLLLLSDKIDNPENIDTLYLKVVKLNPTDPKAYYKYALFKQKIGDTQSAINLLQKSLELKADYKEARIALGIIYESLENPEKAREQYLYVLENINPQDQDAIRFLDSLKN